MERILKDLIGPISGDVFITSANIITNQPNIFIRNYKETDIIEKIIKNSAEKLVDFSGEFVILTKSLLEASRHHPQKYIQELGGIYRSGLIETRL